MILSRFLKFKWQPADPKTREPVAREPANGDPTLPDQTLQQPDPAARGAALERSDNLDQLGDLASAGADAAVRADAQTRYRSLLAGQSTHSPPLAERLERVRNAADPDLAAFLTREAAEPELRLAALEQIDAATVDAEALLAAIALQDAHPEVRLAALERIQDPEHLESIARQSRNRDKRLYRRVRERLDALAAAREHSTRLERLCADMEQLTWDGESGPNAGRFPKLEQEWREIESLAPPPVQERYTQARARFMTDRQASAGRRTQRLELIAALETLLERLRHALEPSAELDAAIQYATREAPTAWTDLGPAQDAESRRLEARFQQRVQEIHDQERLLRRNHQRAERLRDVLRQAETLLHQPSEVREADVNHLRHGWDGLERPEPRERVRELQSRFDGLLDRLRARLQRQVQQRDQEWLELQELAGQLEAAAENGELQHANQFQEQARQKLKHNIGLSRAQMAAIEDRLQACAGRLGELRDWQRWGAHQAREQLCVTAEGLIDLEDEPAEIARRIRQARDAWKALDHQEGGAPKALWKRFNTACERAYAPCQAYFENQFQERQQNQEKKQALCAQLEQFAAETDWQQQVDWREADRLRRRAQEQWYKTGPVNRSERKALDRRFQRILKQLDGHLGAERDRELQRRQQLIQQVQALADHSDLRAAIDAAKRAQAAWPPTVQALPRQEQTLWKEFRAACDAVFDRRQAEQQAVDTERQQNLARKQALCAEIEALTGDSGASLPQARDRLQAIRREWDTLGPIPKAAQREVEQRFETAVQSFDQHQRFLRRAGVREAFQHLHQRSRLCARLEALLAGPAEAATLAEVQELWSTLPPLAEPLQESLQRRHDTLVRVLTDAAPDAAQDLRAQLERNLEQKQIWCVSMEIAAGVESPPEFAQLRMQHQVARLSASLAGDTRIDALHDPRRLQEQWCLTGAWPADAEAALDDRFLAALNAWWQREDA